MQKSDSYGQIANEESNIIHYVSKDRENLFENTIVFIQQLFNVLYIVFFYILIFHFKKYSCSLYSFPQKYDLPKIIFNHLKYCF